MATFTCNLHVAPKDKIEFTRWKHSSTCEQYYTLKFGRADVVIFLHEADLERLRAVLNTPYAPFDPDLSPEIEVLAVDPAPDPEPDPTPTPTT